MIIDQQPPNPTLASLFPNALPTPVLTPVVNVQSSQDGITARAGGGQGGSPLARTLNRVAVVATAGDSVTLPPSSAGEAITLTNSGVNSLNVFPAPGEAINSLGANAAFVLANGKTVTFICYTAGQWFTEPTVP